MQVFESGEVQDMCGEDVSFCLDAIEAGFEIWCDPRIQSWTREDKSDLMSLTRYTILHKGKVLRKNLTEEEYFDMMEDLSVEYYQKGFPRPQDLETKITKY